MPHTIIKGSVELIINPEDPDTATSVGTVVEQATASDVPTLMRILHGITDLEPAEPDNGQQVAIWTGQTPQFRPVRVILWREPDHDETLIGQVLAMVTEGSHEP